MGFRLTPVTGPDLVGREKIIGELEGELGSENQIGFLIYGLRRTGKTSVLKETQRLLEARGMPVIYVSMWNIAPRTVDEFVRVLSRNAIASFWRYLPSKFRLEELLSVGTGAIKAFLSGLKLTIAAQNDLEMAVSYMTRESDDIKKAMTGAFMLTEHLSEMTGRRSVLILDEFPTLRELQYGRYNQKAGESVFGLIRTIHEDFRRTKLVIAGSYRSTLEPVAFSKRGPFYNGLLLRTLAPFEMQELGKFIEHYMGGFKWEQNARETLLQVSGGLPFNLQLLGRELQGSGGGRRITPDDVEVAIRSIIRTEGDVRFSDYLRDLAPHEIRILKSYSNHRG
ncbi:MAG: hypothetical protein JRM78_01880 [Nitrososphaerota archaeon]|nr:hypothetical protein [Nitrososphaerota archaeon]